MRLGPHSVDDPEDGWLANDPEFELSLAREIDECDADENGQDPLARQEEHGDASDDEQAAQGILQDA